MLTLLYGIPVLGTVLGWVKSGVCWSLTQPPDLVVDTLKRGCSLIFGGCQ